MLVINDRQDTENTLEAWDCTVSSDYQSPLNSQVMDEQRKFERIDAPEGAIALAEGNMGKILDISKGGVALMFLDSSFEEIQEEISFDLFASKRDMHATRLTGRRVWTKAVSFSPFSGVVCGKAGIEFTDLSNEQETQLHNLLAHFNPE